MFRSHRSGAFSPLVLALTVLFGTSPASASDDLPVGAFAVDASPVWTIAEAQDGYRAISHLHDQSERVFELTDAGRKALWQRLEWPVDTSRNARCLGNMLDVFCRVGPASAERIEQLHATGSNHFHYDRASGAQAIRPLKR